MADETRQELTEMVDSSSLLVDESIYTRESYRTLIEAISLAKVALQEPSADEQWLRSALQNLCSAVDSLKTVEEPSSEKRTLRFPFLRKKEKFENPEDPSQPWWKKALPYVICGGVVAGSAAVLLSSLLGTEKMPPKKKGWFQR